MLVVLVVLVVDDALVTAPIRYEAPEPGAERFPHVHGPLPVEAVVAVRASASESGPVAGPAGEGGA